MTRSKANKTNKRRVMFIKSTKFARLLNRMRDRYIKENEPDDLVVPYVLLCALALESRLNDALMDKAKQLFRNNSTALEDSFCSMSFRGKLNALVPILTNGKYRINQEHFVYQRLAALISVRNQLAHARSQYEEIQYPHDEPPPDTPTAWNLPQVFFDRAEDMTLDATLSFSPLEYHEALERLNKWFFLRCPDRLTHVDLVRAGSDV